MRSGSIAPPFLSSTLDGGEWSASRPGRFTAGERVSGAHRIGNWVSPRAGLDDLQTNFAADRIQIPASSQWSVAIASVHMIILISLCAAKRRGLDGSGKVFPCSTFFYLIHLYKRR
jgi:hypothetical protein